MASKREPFVIAKAGKPLVRLSALDAPTGKRVRRIGFMAVQISMPADLTGWGRKKLKDSLARPRVKRLLDTHLLLWAV